MNLAVESDDADPKLRDAARRAMRQVIGLFEQIIAEGMKEGEFFEGDARARARLLVASMEGAILLTNLYKDGAYMEAVLDHLERTVRREFAGPFLVLKETDRSPCEMRGELRQKTRAHPTGMTFKPPISALGVR